MKTARLKAYAELLIVALIWGIAGPVIKVTLKNLSPDVFLLYRFFLSSLISFFVIYIKRVKGPKDVSQKLLALLFAFLTSTCSLGFLFWGTNETTLLDMSLISLFGPVMMMVFGFVFLKEHMSKRMKIGAGIAFLGSLAVAIEPLVLGSSHGSGYGNQLLGNVLVFLSLLSGTFSGLLAKKLMRQGVSPSYLANYAFLIGFITLAPITVFLRPPTETIAQIASAGILDHLGVFYMAYLSGTVAYTLTNMAQKTIELSETAIFSYLYPIISAVLAVILLGDKLSAYTIGGCAVTFAGVFISEFKKSSHKNTRMN